jgi:hypothetical protein
MSNSDLRTLIDEFASDMTTKQGYAYSAGFLSSMIGSILSGFYGSTLEEIKQEITKMTHEHFRNNG